MHADLVARAFGLGGGARLSDGPVARGKQGDVWRLETSDGEFAVKVPFDPVAEADVRAAAEFQEAAYDAGVPTPRLCRTTEGDVFGDVGDAWVRVYEWVDLLPPDPMLDPLLVGAALAGVHRVPDPDPDPGGVDAWYAEPVGAERWDGLVRALRAERAPFAEELAGLRDELVALETWVAPPERVQTCHRDLWADNLVPTVVGGVCVVDWENSGPADPAYELGCVLFEFARGDPVRARTLLDAYSTAGGPARISGRADFSMLIAQLGHITGHAAETWLGAAPGSPARAEAATWVAELVDYPHTRRVLDELLAAVGDG
jgi:aminoglycoside phosphotransferase (APT) family kinase protein